MDQKRKKVLIVGSDLSVKGGITSVINNFLNNNWKDIEIELLPTYVEKNSIKKMSFFIKALLKYLIRLLKNDFDIAHIHMSYKGSFYRKLLIVKLSNVFKKKIILHLHGSEFQVFYDNSNWLIKKLIKNIFKSSSCVIVLGERWYNVIKNIYPESKIEILNNAVKIPNSIASWNETKVNILFLGVLIKRKGIYDLIESIRILNEKNIVKENNLNFIIGGSGKEENSIKELINKYKIEDCIEMVGWVDGKKKNELLKKSQVFILPSYNEGLPMSILESMSYGIPGISTNVGSIEEVLKDGYNGIIVKPGDVEELSNAIYKISTNKEKWMEYSANSRSILEEEYNEYKYFNRMINLYKELIS